MSPMAPALANPAAHINRDDTMFLAGMQEPGAGTVMTGVRRQKMRVRRCGSCNQASG